MDAALRLDLHLLQIHAGIELHRDKALHIRLSHDAGYADGIKAVRLHGIAGDGLFGDDEDDLRVLLGLAAGHGAVVVRAQIDGRLRHGDGIMYG